MTQRVGTANFYDRSLFNLQFRQNNLDRAQEELATGKKVINPSDDPVAANSIIKLNKELEVSQRFIDAQSTAERFNRDSHAALDSMYIVLQRVQETITRSVKGSLDGDSRQALRKELESRFIEFQGLANKKNANGDFLFSGFQSDVKSFTADRFGYMQYRGDDGQRELLISPSFQVAATDAGSSLFTNVTPLYTTYEQQSSLSGGEVSVGLVTDPDEFVAPVNDYQIVFTSTPAGGNADQYYVIDNTATSPLSVPGAPNVVSGPHSFSAGDEIKFNGISVKTDPLTNMTDGEIIRMEPSSPNHTSMFYIFQQALDALNIEGTAYQSQANKNSTLSVSGGLIKDIDEHTLADFDLVFNEVPAGSGNYTVEVNKIDRSQNPPVVLENTLPAEAYDPTGTDLNFNGIDIKITGTPGNQDVIPATSATLPETVRLDKPESDRRSKILTGLLEEVDNSLTNVDNILSQIGARLNSLDNENDSQRKFKETVTATKADIEEIDIYEAVTNLENSRIGLQAAQQAFARIQNLSLFEFI